MTICGAGGAATAICIQAALDGVKEISIFNRKDDFYANAEKQQKKSIRKQIVKHNYLISKTTNNYVKKSQKVLFSQMRLALG